MRCHFVSDLHGRPDRYEKLWRAVAEEAPEIVFLGGDLLPSGLEVLSARDPDPARFVSGFLARGFEGVRRRLGERYPRVLLILGNDDSRLEEASIRNVAGGGLWTYLHNRRWRLPPYTVLGYSFVPPTPFLMKDWERYDVSRYVPHGSVSPEEGWRSVPAPPQETRYATIQHDLEVLAGDDTQESTVCLFHSPPHATKLDRAALDGKAVDDVPLDLHVGSIAIRRFIERRQPLLSLHGHVHESARLTGAWRDRIGRTHMFGAAHDGEELALVRFSLDDLDGAMRDLI